MVSRRRPVERGLSSLPPVAATINEHKIAIHIYRHTQQTGQPATLGTIEGT
jgi:hypothetical protein